MSNNKKSNEGISLSSLSGMGEVSLPSNGNLGSGDVPADKKDKKDKKVNMRKGIPSFNDFVRPVEANEAMDINDPMLIKLRAAQMKKNAAAAKKAEKTKPVISPAKAKKIQDLKDERKEILRDMEQEAEMEGGSIADKYGDMLNKIDQKIIKLGGNPLSEAKLSGLSGFGKLEYTIDDLNLSYGWAGTLSDHFDDEDKAILLTQQAIKDLGKAIGLSQKEALGLLNSKAGRHMADLFIDGGAVDSTAAAIKYLGNKAKVSKYAKEAAASQFESTETVNEWGSSDQNIMNQQIHKDAGSPKKMPSPFDRKLRAAAEDAVDWHWDEWPEYKRDRAGLIDNAVRSYLRSYFPKDWEIMVRMFEPMESVQITEGSFVVWYEDQEGKHLLGTFHNKKAAEKYKSEEEDEMLNTKGVESVGMMSKDMWDKTEAPYIKEDLNEAKSIAKIQKEYSKVVNDMAEVVTNWKAAKESGDARAEANFLARLKDLTAQKKSLVKELDDAIGLKDVDAELAESTVNEMTSDAAIALADEVSGELYTARLKGKSATINATTTTKTWDDGVPVLKYLARGKAKPVTFSLYQRPFKVVHDVAHNWFYFTDGRKWYGLHGDEGYFEPSDLPFTMEISESLDESLKLGSYYFPKSSHMIDSILPEGGWKRGETKYAVICHNTVQVGKNIMYLKSDSSKIGQNFETHIMSIHNTEEEAFQAFQDAVKYDEGTTDSCVSFAYGTLTSKGGNMPFNEIGGERRRFK